MNDRRKRWITAALLSAACFLVATSASAQGPYEPLVLDPDDIPEGAILIEGDILTRDPEMGGVAGSFTTRGKLWPDGIVPYKFDTAGASTGYVSLARRRAMRDAMAVWEGEANIDFVPRTTHRNYLFIRNSNANNSWVGVQGRSQEVNIRDWGAQDVMLHELGHALGYRHTQNRYDRDSYLAVKWGNIRSTCGRDRRSSCAYNFNKRDRSDGRDYGPYDFDSIMHYTECAFSTCASTCPSSRVCASGGRTIVLKAPNQDQQSTIGTSTVLSKMDRLVMSFLYPEDNWRFVDLECRCPFIFGSCIGEGSFWCPKTTLQSGIDVTPVGGTLWVEGGRYPKIVLNKRMTIRSPLGGALIGKGG